MHNEYYDLLAKYREEDNYISSTFNNGPICYVFISSQGIFHCPWDCEGMRKTFDTDRFEWKNIAKNRHIIRKSAKQIFVRDIGKELYQRGINARIDSIPKLIDFLKEQTKGYDTYLVGSSSGGYLAFLASQLPNIKRIYSFGGLLEIGGKSTYHDLKKEFAIDEKYINVEPYIGRQCRIVHSYGALNEEDIANFEILKEHHSDQCVFIPIESMDHAARPYGEDIIKLLVCSDTYLSKIGNKLSKYSKINRIKFSLLNGNFYLCIKIFARKVFGKK